MFAIFVTILFILGVLFNALVLKLIARKFKIQNNTYKNAVLISFFEIVFNGLIGTVVGFILAGLLGFIIFNLLCKKYYLTKLKKNIVIYLLLNLVVMVVSLIIIIPVRSFIAEPFYVSGDAMLPTFPDNTYMIINKFSKNFQKGDVIVLKSPQDENQYLIKRIVGLPNEKIEIEGASVNLGPNEYYVLGDNIKASTDSRSFGPVNTNLIVGKYWFSQR